MITVCAGSCENASNSPEITRAFYFWKSNAHFSPAEIHALDTLGISKLYVKYFDVTWDEKALEPIPVAKLSFNNKTAGLPAGRKLEIVPTVFITNECLTLMDSTHIPLLAKNINDLISRIHKIAGWPGANTKEIQFDCDWTASTAPKYFNLLREIRRLNTSSGKLLSATIRLYQCKYLRKTGVPPVDRGLLMCYNMGNLRDPSIRSNSILDIATLRQYEESLETYPLPLDVALPLFEWKVRFRDDVFAGLIQNLPDSTLSDNSHISREHNNYQFLQDTVINGYSFKKGDRLRSESCSADQVSEAAQIIKQRLTNKKFTVSLYHLDSITISKYSIHELEDIFHNFN